MRISINPLRLIIVIALLLLPLALSAQSELRVVHLSPDAPPVDIYIDGASTPTVSGLAFGGATIVQKLPTRTTRVMVTPAGMPSLVLLDADVDLTANSRMNVLALNSATMIEASTISLPLGISIPSDSAQVRVVHASPDAGNVDVKIIDASGTPRIFSDVSFKMQSPFVTIPQGNVMVELYQAGTENLLLRAGGIVPGGERGTVFASGTVSGMKLRILYEGDTAAQIPMTMFGAPATVDAETYIRAVHLVPDAPAVDIYTNGNKTVSALAYRDASAQVEVDSGSYTLGVTVAGAPLGTAVINTNLALNPDSAYTIVALGALATPPSILTLTRAINMAVEPDSALVRIVHAAPDIGAVDATLRDARGRTSTMNDVAFKTATEYMKLPAGPVWIDVDPEGSAIYQAVGVLSGGSVVTIFVNGQNATQSVALHALIESDTGAQTPMMILGMQEGAIRVAHLVPDVGTFDIYVGNNTTEPLRISFREASAINDEFVPGMFDVKIAPQGGGIGGAVLTTQVQIKQDTLQTIFAVGSLASGNLGVVALPSADEDRAPSGQSALRLLNASADAGTIDAEWTLSSGGTPLRFNNVPFKGNTAYVNVPPGATSVRLFAAGSTTPILSVQGTLPADQLLTAIISGSVATGTLGVNLLLESEDAQQAPMVLFSPTSSVAIDAREASAMAIVPNPAHERAVVSYSSSRSGMIDLALYNALGELVLDIDGELRDAGPHTISLPIGSLPSGVYTAVLSRDGARIGVEKVIVK